MAGNLPDGCTQADVDRAAEEREEPMTDPREWKLLVDETTTSEYDKDGRFLGIRTARRNSEGAVIYEAFASAEDLLRDGQGAGSAARTPESQRDVFEALLKDWTDFETAERVRDFLDPQAKATATAQAKAAEWLARYDAAVQAEWIPTSVALPVVGAPPYYPSSEPVVFAVAYETESRAGRYVAHPDAGDWWADGDRWADGDENFQPDQVTHWRPMPAPPPR